MNVSEGFVAEAIRTSMELGEKNEDLTRRVEDLEDRNAKLGKALKHMVDFVDAFLGQIALTLADKRTPAAWSARATEIAQDGTVGGAEMTMPHVQVRELLDEYRVHTINAEDGLRVSVWHQMPDSGCRQREGET